MKFFIDSRVWISKFIEQLMILCSIRLANMFLACLICKENKTCKLYRTKRLNLTKNLF